MVLFLLLLVPVLIGIVAKLRGKGRMTLKEFLIHEAVVTVLISAGYFLALHFATSDTEIWSGTVVSKGTSETQCCHSYKCNCHTTCTGSGSSRSCSESCSTCYRHSSDRAWWARSSNDEEVYRDGCNSPGTPTPARWTEIKEGDPTAFPHTFTNYIKGNPDPLGMKSGFLGEFQALLPDYPEVFDYYRVNRLLTPGLTLPDHAILNERISRINARLGAARQVNIIVILVATPDPRYLAALREHWLGGKKNDLIVVIGAVELPAISWVDVLSWTSDEDIRPKLRARIKEIGKWEGGAVLDVIEDEVEHRFVRRPMADFEYLKETLQPPTWALALLLVLGVASSLLLSRIFLQNHIRDA